MVGEIIFESDSEMEMLLERVDGKGPSALNATKFLMLP